jgi:two-component system, LytTR family, sensor kinase
MKKFLVAVFLPLIAHGQIDWKNYSTSFQGSGKEGSRPTLVTAIPYNGRYDGATYGSGRTQTVDSGEVYFLVPGTHPANAERYEYRVILDGATIIRPWGPITRFTDSGVALNEFTDRFGFLGGFTTTWGHSILVDLREKATGAILSSSVVSWTADRPRLRGIYTASNLPDFVGSKSEYWTWKPDSLMQRRLELLYKGDLSLTPGDNTLIFYVGADIYQKTALEYQLKRDASVVLSWGPNDFNNDMVLLQDLRPGAYTLELRFRAQRHNISRYNFTILPAWYQSRFFWLLLTALLAAAVGALALIFFLIRQRRRTKRERAARDKLNLELRGIRAQLNPHFIFNALSSIQGLVNGKDVDAANRYLSEFGALLRDSLAASEKDFTDLSREMGILDTYLKLEQLRFGFRYSIDVSPEVPAGGTEIPAFLLQPLVENAVKHGVAPMHDEGFIQVHFFRQNTTFIARIGDNGRGWNTADQRTAGYGLKLTRERIRLLNRLLDGRRIDLVLPSAHRAAVIEVHFSNWWT